MIPSRRVIPLLPRTSENALYTRFDECELKEIIALSSVRASLLADMSATKSVRVMLVEDHLAFRQALASLLFHEPDLEVVAQAGSLPKPDRCSTLLWTLR